MPLILLAVALIFAPVVLMPVSLVLRYRAGVARRQARGWVTAINLGALALSTAMFLTGAAVTSLWVPHAFSYSLLGFLGGFALGIIGLWLSRFERGPQALHYTPNRWLVLAVTLLVTARVLYGVWRGYHTLRYGAGDTPWTSAFGIAGSMSAGAVVLGYYLSYWMGLRRRLRRHQGR